MKELILNRNVSREALNHKSETPLGIAVANGRFTVVEFLLEQGAFFVCLFSKTLKGADFDAPSGLKAQTPLCIAASILASVNPKF